MREGDDGGPLVGADARSLGARARDIQQHRDGSVYPEQGGMSVSPLPPENLPRHRRPERFGGSGKDAVWALETDELPSQLMYRPDPSKPETHGFIEPAYRMTFERYQLELEATSYMWSRV